GANCAQQPVCCTNNNFNGLVRVISHFNVYCKLTKVIIRSTLAAPPSLFKGRFLASSGCSARMLWSMTCTIPYFINSPHDILSKVGNSLTCAVDS
ncbi:hypothetical protein M422DRAFT_197093, partial [Sphaerobolus stellatus SS14]